MDTQIIRITKSYEKKTRMRSTKWETSFPIFIQAVPIEQFFTDHRRRSRKRYSCLNSSNQECVRKCSPRKFLLLQLIFWSISISVPFAKIWRGSFRFLFEKLEIYSPLHTHKHIPGSNNSYWRVFHRSFESRQVFTRKRSTLQQTLGWAFYLCVISTVLHWFLSVLGCCITSIAVNTKSIVQIQVEDMAIWSCKPFIQF